MNITIEDIVALEDLDGRIRAILPEQYQDVYDDVQPVSMGSAGLKFANDGRVAWNEIWATFCDLAMAGGPPHRGVLLEPAAEESIAAQPAKYKTVVEEIARGITLVTGLPAQAGEPGWVEVRCRTQGMAGWLVRAIVMENVMASHNAETLLLPAGPEFRLEKEIKNVITATAKTNHYWTGHISEEQQWTIDSMFRKVKLLEPAGLREVQSDPDGYRTLLVRIQSGISERLGMVCFPNRYIGCIGVECPDVHAAIWIMRAMVVENIVARREGNVLFLPVQPEHERLLETLERVRRLHTLASRK